MIKSPYAVYPDSLANFTLNDPIIMKGVLAVNTDEDDGRMKLGDGVNHWSLLSYVGGSTLGTYLLPPSTPVNNEIIRYSDFHGRYEYSLHGMVDSETNWSTNSDTFPTFCILIETDDVTDNPTGRVKFSDGLTPQDDIPWIWFNLSEFPTGYSPYYTGTTIGYKQYQEYNTLPFSDTPIGKVLLDSGAWGYPTIIGPVTDLTTTLLESDDIYAFDTITLGGFPTEPTSITLTSDGTDLFIDSQKVWSVSNDGHGSSLDADTLDTYHASSFALVSHDQPATTIELTNKAGATYTTVQQWADAIQSSGRISGGVITAHAPADGTIDVSALTGFIKLTDSSIGSVECFDQAAQSSIALTDNATNYIYIDYNAGSPQILVTTDRSTIRHTDQFNLGRAFRSGTTVEVLTSGVNLYNRTRLIHEKWIDTFGGVSYASGITTSCTGLKPAITAGVLYAGSNKITIDAKDCNTSGTFDAYYTIDSGTTWTIQTGQTTLNNTQYNNVATGLATLSNNRYAVRWLYVCPDGDIYVLYGQSDYTLANAQAASAPSLVPNYLAQWAKLAAKIIILKSATSVYSITMAWATQFPVQSAGDHNDLAGLQGGTTDQYYHLTATEYNTTVPRYWGELASAPATFKAGDYYYHTGDLKLKFYVASVGWLSMSVS